MADSDSNNSTNPTDNASVENSIVEANGSSDDAVDVSSIIFSFYFNKWQNHPGYTVRKKYT